MAKKQELPDLDYPEAHVPLSYQSRLRGDWVHGTATLRTDGTYDIEVLNRGDRAMVRTRYWAAVKRWLAKQAWGKGTV